MRVREIALASSLLAGGFVSGSPEAQAQGNELFTTCNGNTTTVYDGEGIGSVALRTRTPVETILALNTVDNVTDVVHVGDVVCISGTPSPTTPRPSTTPAPAPRTPNTPTPVSQATSTSCSQIVLTQSIASILPGSDGDRVLDNGREAQAVQNALNVQGVSVGRANGVIGSRTLAGFGNFQQNRFGTVDCILGPQTFRGLGIVAANQAGSVAPSSQSSSRPNANPTLSDYQRDGVFNPAQDCPRVNSCELFYDLSDRRGSVRVNDGLAQSANGTALYNFAIQPGKPGDETNTGRFRLGPIEYGPNNSPWKWSTITPVSARTNAPGNMYKFRRHFPVNGGWSGEGTHGSNSYGYGPGSSGCARVTNATQDVLAHLPTNTSLLIQQ